MKIIKLTEKQLKEAEGNSFEYLNGSDVGNYTGNTEISPVGKVSDDEYGNPVTTDDIAKQITPNSYNRYGSYIYSNNRSIKESFEDDDNDGIDDFYDNEQIETLSDDDKSNNLTRIPKGVEDKINLLINQIDSSSLNPKQQAMVLTKLINSMDTDRLPISWRKNLILRINSKKK